MKVNINKNREKWGDSKTMPTKKREGTAKYAKYANPDLLSGERSGFFAYFAYFAVQRIP